MANAYERWSERTGTKSANNSDVGVRVFDITGAATEADCYTADLVLTDLSNPTGKVPVLNEVDPRNSRRKVNSLAVSTVGLNLLRLTVGYAIPVNGDSFDGTDTNPLTEPVRWSWQRSKVIESIDRDKDGNPIVNSNRMPFANGAQRTYTQRILEARRNEATYPAALAEAFEDTVNTNTFSGPPGVSFGAGKVKCNIITVLGEYSSTSPYVEVLYQFEIRPDGWATRQLDEGAMGRDSDGNFLPLYSLNGDKVTAPVLLNGGGNPVDSTSYKLGSPTDTIAGASDPNPPPGATIETAPGGEAAFLRYKVYNEADLSVLAL
jgi:hypothetical protein